MLRFSKWTLQSLWPFLPLLALRAAVCHPQQECVSTTREAGGYFLCSEAHLNFLGEFASIAVAVGSIECLYHGEYIFEAKQRRAIVSSSLSPRWSLPQSFKIFSAIDVCRSNTVCQILGSLNSSSTSHMFPAPFQTKR